MVQRLKTEYDDLDQEIIETFTQLEASQQYLRQQQKEVADQKRELRILKRKFNEICKENQVLLSREKELE